MCAVRAPPPISFNSLGGTPPSPPGDRDTTNTKRCTRSTRGRRTHRKTFAIHMRSGSARREAARLLHRCGLPSIQCRARGPVRPQETIARSPRRCPGTLRPHRRQCESHDQQGKVVGHHACKARKHRPPRDDSCQNSARADAIGHGTRRYFEGRIRESEESDNPSPLLGAEI